MITGGRIVTKTDGASRRYVRWAESQFPKISRSSFPEPGNVTLNHKRDFREAVR